MRSDLPVLVSKLCCLGYSGPCVYEEYYPGRGSIRYLFSGANAQQGQPAVPILARGGYLYPLATFQVCKLSFFLVPVEVGGAYAWGVGLFPTARSRGGQVVSPLLAVSNLEKLLWMFRVTKHLILRVFYRISSIMYIMQA